MWCSERMENVSWTNRVKREVLQGQGGRKYSTYNINVRGKAATMGIVKRLLRDGKIGKNVCLAEDTILVLPDSIYTSGGAM